ncbi:MAG: serpin family protein, partial [Thermoplasmatota archaeon]
MKGPSEFLMVLLLVAILFAGCTEKGEEDKEEETHLGEWTYDYLDASGSSEDGIDEIIGANNEFGLDIFRVLAEEDGNLFISPYSIFTALSMTYEGADGDTADEMKDVLHFPDDEDERRGSFASVQNGIRNESSDYDLSTANAIWPSKDHQFYDAFINMITRYYYGEVEELDYWNDPEGSRDTINDWADDETNGRIDELLPEGSIDPSVVMVLTNAIYFKGEWRYEFDEDDTYSGDFHLDDDEKVTADLMKMKTRLNYSEGDDVMMVEIVLLLAAAVATGFSVAAVLVRRRLIGTVLCGVGVVLL